MIHLSLTLLLLFFFRDCSYSLFVSVAIFAIVGTAECWQSCLGRLLVKLLLLCS